MNTSLYFDYLYFNFYRINEFVTQIIMKTEKKILSIVVPTYNIKDYIRKCLSSFLNNDLLPLIEVIVVNDGSTDSSSSIAKEFLNKYPQSFVVIDKENGGHGSTINTALKIASGSFFMVVDGDDWVDSIALLKVVKKLQENNYVDAIFFNYVSEIKYKDKQKKHNLKKVFGNEGNVILDDAKIDVTTRILLANTIYKTSNLRSIKLFLDENTFYVDVEYLVYPLTTIKNAIYVNEYVYHYLIGRPAQSTNMNTALNYINDRKKVITNIINYFKINQFNFSSKYSKRSYLVTLASSINHHYNMLIFSNKKFSVEIKKFDLFLKENDIELYRFVGKKFKYIKIARKTNYNRFIMKFTHFIDAKLKKLKKVFRGD